MGHPQFGRDEAFGFWGVGCLPALRAPMLLLLLPLFIMLLLIRTHFFIHIPPRERCVDPMSTASTDPFYGRAPGTAACTW